MVKYFKRKYLQEVQIMGNTMDINEGAKLYKETAGAVLLDVRKPDEYSEGHIPGSITAPRTPYVPRLRRQVD